jgi:hypothetical protein
MTPSVSWSTITSTHREPDIESLAEKAEVDIAEARKFVEEIKKLIEKSRKTK